ncbi:hypothetical protein RRG08_022677 [Elysia crispata]|uniref:Uncharacterized protein n=1 Tax=Elysia crispata TaxID=231223 RepID=A0AAE1D9E9_9GAST|nr:hypothetical protein RRG08_022677 [Elysia crispata]
MQPCLHLTCYYLSQFNPETIRHKGVVITPNRHDGSGDQRVVSVNHLTCDEVIQDQNYSGSYELSSPAHSTPATDMRGSGQVVEISGCPTLLELRPGFNGTSLTLA